jgi:hypothetical protein
MTRNPAVVRSEKKITVFYQALVIYNYWRFFDRIAFQKLFDYILSFFTKIIQMYPTKSPRSLKIWSRLKNLVKHSRNEKFIKFLQYFQKTFFFSETMNLLFVLFKNAIQIPRFVKTKFIEKII